VRCDLAGGRPASRCGPLALVAGSDLVKIERTLSNE
jgi:hypothetical protein